jgi:hypothetical protein
MFITKHDYYMTETMCSDSLTRTDNYRDLGRVEDPEVPELSGALE